jgi:hypothetical protein
MLKRVANWIWLSSWVAFTVVFVGFVVFVNVGGAVWSILRDLGLVD